MAAMEDMMSRVATSLKHNYEKFRLNNTSVEFPNLSKVSASMIMDIPTDKVSDEKWLSENLIKSSNARERALTKLKSINPPKSDMIMPTRIMTEDLLLSFQVAYYRQFTTFREDMCN